MNKAGFTLIELLVVMMLIGIMATVVVPNLWRAQPGYERKNFITQLNALMNYGRQQAIITHTVHQLFVNFEKKRIELRAPAEKKNDKGELVYNQVRGMIATAMTIPAAIEMKNFIIEGFDELGRYVGRATGSSYFFIVPEGMTQEVTINFLDTKDVMYDGKPRPVGLVLNPFTAQFKEYDSFQK